MAIAADVSRVEKKFVLTTAVAENLFAKLRQILPGDDYSGYNPYYVRSLYFDSFKNDDYWDKLAGIELRKKIRLRVYNAEKSVIKLEVKQKEGENQRKRSLTIAHDEALDMINGNVDFLLKREDSIAQDIYYIFKTELYQPKCIVQYKRRAFAIPTNNIRITFDSEITSSEGHFDLFDSFPGVVYPVESKNVVVLEVKYNHFLLSYVKDALQMCDAVESSYSKYVTARMFSLG